MVFYETKERTEASDLGYSLTTKSTGLAQKELLPGRFHELAKGRHDTVGHAPRF